MARPPKPHPHTWEVERRTAPQLGRERSKHQISNLPASLAYTPMPAHGDRFLYMLIAFVTGILILCLGGYRLVTFHIFSRIFIFGLPFWRSYSYYQYADWR